MERINKLINNSTKLTVHFIALINVIFLTIYTRVVCPLLNNFPFFELFLNLIYCFIFQVFLREIFFLLFKNSTTESAPRKLYISSIWTWTITGIVCTASFFIYYDPFPWHSGLKLFSGYGILGAGICAQIEYLLYEKNYKKKYSELNAISFLDRIPRRITESTFIFTLAPSLAMLIMVIRYSIQDKIIPINVVFEVAYIAVFFLIICLWASQAYGKELKKDAEKITEALNQIGQGKLEISLETSRSDELGIVSKGINEMVAGLKLREKIKEAFGHFVSPKIAEEFIEKYSKGESNFRDQGKRKKLAILMSDIRNFTSLSEKIKPEQVTKILNGYFNEMVQAVEANGGIIDKFIGDAVMAIFGLLDESNTNPSLSAVKTGLAMEKSLKKFNQENQQNLKIGIGIHIGEVIAGYIGSDNRLEFTVIGSPVNLTSRIEQETKDPNIPNILFSSEISQEIEKEIPIQYIKDFLPKGIGAKVPLYAVKT